MGENQTWGLAPFKALSMGKRTIVSDGCGAAKVLHDQCNVVKTGNISEIIDCFMSPIEIDKKNITVLLDELSIKNYVAVFWIIYDMTARDYSVVVFGSSGLVGSSLRYYLRKYHNDKYLYYPTRAEVDLLSVKDVVSYIKKLKPEFVINAAGYVGGIDRVRRDPYDFLVKNIDIDLNILKACIVVPNTSLIGFSSINAFGQLPNTLVDESFMLRGRLDTSQEPYALAKGIAAKAFDFARSQYKINATTIILEQLYGPKDHFFGDKAHMLPSAVRKICDAITENSKSVEIWGNGEAKRSYTYAPDAALL